MASPYRILRWWLLPLLRWRIDRVVGLENLPTASGFIVCPNHQSWIDSAMVAAALYQHIRKPLKYISQTSKYRLFGAIPIQEYNRAETLQVAEGYLRAGHPIVIFPEGNSNPEPTLRPARTGAVRLALRSNAPIVPVGVRGTVGRSWGMLAWYLSFWKRCEVHFGAPMILPVTELTGHDDELLNTHSHQLMKDISRLSGKPLAISTTPLPYKQTAGWQRWLIRTLRLTFVGRVRVEGADNLPATGPFIVVANHQGYMDPPTLHIAVWKARHLSPFFLTKASVVAAFQKVFGRGIVDALGMLPLDSQEPSRVLGRAEAHLRRCGVVGIFPEGKRNTPRLNPNWQTTLLKGKTGTARLMLQTRAPVIPAGIIVPQGYSIGAAILNALLPWRKTTVCFGPPIHFSNLPSGEPTHTDLEKIAGEIMVKIGQLCGKSYPA